MPGAQPGLGSAGPEYGRIVDPDVLRAFEALTAIHLRARGERRRMERVEALFDTIDSAADSGPSRELRLWTFVDDTTTECVRALDEMIRVGVVNRGACVALYRRTVDLHARTRAAFLMAVEGRTLGTLPAEDAADLALLQDVVAVLRGLVTGRAGRI